MNELRPAEPFDVRDTILRLVLVATLVGVLSTGLRAAEATWKAGTAKAIITPQQPMWMAGYATRTRPADGTLHELYVRVLALEDAEGKRAVVVSNDLLGISRSVSEKVTKTLRENFGLSPDQVMLNASHTHSGPVLRSALYDAYPLDQEQIKRIEDYSTQLERTIVRTVGEALARMTPVRVSRGEGMSGFAVNRRNNREPDVPELKQRHALRGPTDHSVPVLAVRGLDDKLRAVVFAYACHNTTLSIQQWNGDYAGFAETNLETAFPGAVALFCMGCGGDQNPIPRRSVELCRHYGRMMSDAVAAVLARQLEPLAPKLRTEYESVTLELGAAPTRDELKSLAENGAGSYIKRWAGRLLREKDAGRPLARNYPYPVEIWQLGGKQLWIALGGEVVVDYDLRFKDRYGADTWVTSYANDVMAYIPSRRVIREGGYEGNTSMMVYGMPAERWDESIEETITTTVDRLVHRLGPVK
jgi:neutral/alkaline ceramidase-like enzyme